MSLDYSNAAPPTDFSLVPDGTKAFGILKIRPAGPGGQPEDWIAVSKSSDAQYLDCELTICEGPFNKRKIFTKIGVAGSEKYINSGRSAIRALLEVGRGASPANMNAYKINSYGDLDGLKVAFEVKIEKGTDGYQDKNDVRTWLTPDPGAAGISKKFQALVAAAQAGYPAQAGASTGAPATAAPAWAGTPPAAQQSATAATPATSKPAWL